MIIKINGVEFELIKTKFGESITNLSDQTTVAERNSQERQTFITLRRFFDKN